jgi:Ser/Thr protein kinase RdoA (MazF antagonist)
VAARYHAGPVARDELERAARSAELATTIVPEVGGRVGRLLDRLEVTAPHDLTFGAAHGDFHAGQLLVRGDEVAIVDFDRMCSAPAALDLASYAARVVSGRADDAERALATLDALVDGFDRRPVGLRWHLSAAILRRSTAPFVTQEAEWAEAVTARVIAADEIMR